MDLKTIQTELVKLSDIIPNPNNPRIIKDDKFKKLVKSIQDFPEMLTLRPIVVNDDMVILGGNMRLKACKEAGLKKVPIAKASQLTPEQQQEFIIKDNIGYGEWQWDVLANDYDVEKLEEWGLDVPKFQDASEPNDLSETIDKLYRIEIVCKDEEHQENSYNKLIEQGYECRLLTL